MGYVYEKISETDVEAYGLEAINQQVFVGRILVSHWVIDRKRNSYLRQESQGRPDVDEGISRWTFYWNNSLIWIRIDRLFAKWVAENRIHAKFRVVEMAPLAQDLVEQRHTVQALIEALEAHTMAGGSSPFKAHCEYEFAPGVLNVQA